MSYLEQLSMAQLYVSVVAEAGMIAKQTKDPVWTGLFIAGVAVAVAWGWGTLSLLEPLDADTTSA